MPSQNYLSNKKNEKLSISTSPALKEWISRYANVMHQKFPDDKTFNSISSLVHNILENVMKIFENGKTLEDFERFVDSEIDDFYDQITFKAPISLFEDVVELNKYMDIKKTTLRTLIGYRGFITKNFNYEDLDLKKNAQLLQRFGNFIVKNKVTHRFDVYVEGKTIVMEYEGSQYPNLHYEYSKLMAALMGIIGFRVISVDYIENYTRYRIEEDYLFRVKGLQLKERKKLIAYNIKSFLRYDYIVDDNNYHLWSNLSQSKDNIINFSDYRTGITYIKSKINELIENVPINDLNKYLLKMFEQFHWITIDNLDALAFSIRISKEDHSIPYKIIIETFSNNLKFEDDIYYLLE